MKLVISFQEADEPLIQELRERAEQQNVSLDALVLDLVRLGLEASKGGSQLRIYHDLDDLAGTWSAQEAKAFERVMADFEKIDERLWQ
jgi:hypothetical protein